MKVVIYARYSSENQSEESITAQLRACKEYARRTKLKVVDTYIDRAKSARSDKRPAFQRMIADSEKHTFDAIVVHKLDRFSRDRFDHAVYRRKLKKNGVKLLSVLENLDSSPESIVLESVLEGFSEYYSANLARETRKGLRETALQARYTGGNVLYGYRVGADRRYEINPQEADVVRRIFDACIKQNGYGKLLDELRHNGIKTRAERPFTASSFYYILHNPRYTGDYVYSPNGNRTKKTPSDELIIVPDAIPAIISRDTYNQVQRLMKKREHAGRAGAVEPFLLSGIIYCGSCGGRMHGHRQKKRDSDYVYYAYECDNKTRRKSCHARSVPRDRIENAVCNYVKTLMSDFSIKEIETAFQKKFLDSRSKVAEDIKALESERVKISLKIEKALDLLLEMPSPSLQNKIQQFEQEKADLENRIANLRAMPKKPPKLTDEIIRCLNFDELSRAEKAEIIKKLIKKVTIYEDGDEKIGVVATVYQDLFAYHTGHGGATLSPFLEYTCRF